MRSLQKFVLLGLLATTSLSALAGTVDNLSMDKVSVPTQQTQMYNEAAKKATDYLKLMRGNLDYKKAELTTRAVEDSSVDATRDTLAITKGIGTSCEIKMDISDLGRAVNLTDKLVKVGEKPLDVSANSEYGTMNLEFVLGHEYTHCNTNLTNNINLNFLNASQNQFLNDIYNTQVSYSTGEDGLNIRYMVAENMADAGAYVGLIHKYGENSVTLKNYISSVQAAREAEALQGLKEHTTYNAFSVVDKYINEAKSLNGGDLEDVNIFLNKVANEAVEKTLMDKASVNGEIKALSNLGSKYEQIVRKHVSDTQQNEASVLHYLGDANPFSTLAKLADKNVDKIDGYSGFKTMTDYQAKNSLRKELQQSVKSFLNNNAEASGIIAKLTEQGNDIDNAIKNHIQKNEGNSSFVAPSIAGIKDKLNSVRLASGGPQEVLSVSSGSSLKY